MIRYKTLHVKNWGWQLVAGEFARMGWTIEEANRHTTTEHTTTYYTDGTERHESRVTSVFVALSLSRDEDEMPSGGFRVVEGFFTVFFFLRRILGALAPILGIIFFIVMLTGSGETEIGSAFVRGFVMDILFWAVFLLTEFILSFVGKSLIQKHWSN